MPQCSILEPILLNINGLPNVSTILRSLLYADGTNILHANLDL